MRRVGVVVAVAVGATFAAGLGLVPPVSAALRESTVGNYYFQDDATGSRERIVVDRGDQIRFTVREAGFSPHNVRVDELGIRSPDLQLFDTFTTPVLDRPGSYRLYCSRHHDNPGQPHVAELVVRSAAPPPATSTTSAPAAPARPPPARPGPGGVAAPTPTSAPAGSVPASPTETVTTDGTTGATTGTVPAGLGRATDRRRPPPAEGSLASILGRRPEPGPWTRAVRMGMVALVAMVAMAGVAVARGRAGRSDP